MEPFAVRGTFADQRGVEHVVWNFAPYRGPSRKCPSFEVRSRIRGVDVSGFDFEILAPEDPDLAEDIFDLDGYGDLHGYTATGLLPLTLSPAGGAVEHQVEFEVRVPPTPSERERSDGQGGPNAALRLQFRSVSLEVRDYWFEDAWTGLLSQMGPSLGAKCCFTCLYSDYPPGGHSGIGMSCHRDDRAQYLQVRSKGDYWTVPVTEEVPENYLCGEWARRVEGTGYRG